MSEIIFSTSGKFFSTCRSEVRAPDKMSCSEKSNTAFAVVRWLAGKTVPAILNNRRKCNNKKPAPLFITVPNLLFIIMIEYITGELAELSPTQAVVEAHGVGYGLNISLTTYDAFKDSKTARLFVYESIREDAYVLYGFASKDERAVFVALLSVSGVGGNTARTILSAFSPDEFRAVVAGEDSRALTSVKGIGQKTAQRIIVDLKDKLAGGIDATLPSVGAAERGSRQANAEEAIGALATLGYPAAVSQKVVAGILKERNDDIKVEEIIKLALKLL